jgi:hypothetical protein
MDGRLVRQMEEMPDAVDRFHDHRIRRPGGLIHRAFKGDGACDARDRRRLLSGVYSCHGRERHPAADHHCQITPTSSVHVALPATSFAA